MSKNFELMQNLGKEREMFQTATAPAPLPLPIEPLPVVPRNTEVRPPAEVKPLELKMERGSVMNSLNWCSECSLLRERTVHGWL